MAALLEGVGIANYVSDPVFRARLARTPEEDPQAAIGEFVGQFSNPELTWEDLEFLRSLTTLPIALKGILHADDARAAREHGIDAVVVSNHGGRQVDGAIASLDADAVLLGRPYLWGSRSAASRARSPAYARSWPKLDLTVGPQRSYAPSRSERGDARALLDSGTMLILPPGHGRPDQQRYAFQRREKLMIGGVLGLLAVVAVALAISFATVGKKSGHGCISVSLAYSTGGAQLYRCGPSARSLCASVNQSGGTRGGAALSLVPECRKAGLPVG